MKIKQCINCKFYKVNDEAGGFCRWSDKTEKTAENNWPETRSDKVCEHWLDCGQNYYVRLGWLAAQKKKEQDVA